MGDVAEGDQGAHTFKRPAPWELQDNEQKEKEAALGGGEGFALGAQDEDAAQGGGGGGGVEEFGEESLVAGKQPASTKKAERKKRGPQVIKWSTSQSLGPLQDAQLAVVDPEWSTLTEATVLRRPPHDRDLLGGCIDAGLKMSLGKQQATSKQNYSVSFNSIVPRFKDREMEDKAAADAAAARAQEPPPVTFSRTEEKKASSMFKSSTGHQELSNNAFWESQHR
jgi:hypothetical protein